MLHPKVSNVGLAMRITFLPFPFFFSLLVLVMHEIGVEVSPHNRIFAPPFDRR